MIWWVYGNTGSGKTTLAQELANGIDAILLDGDQMRESISKDLSFTEEDRKENNKRIARLAKVLEGQGRNVVVSTICPYEKLREEVFYICKCRFIKIEGGYTT